MDGYGDDDFEIDLEDADIDTTEMEEIEVSELEEFDSWSTENQSLMISAHAMDMIAEGEMEAAEIADLVEDGLLELEHAELVEQEANRNIVKLTKYAKLEALQERSILIMARAAKDPLYTKYNMWNAKRLDIKAQLKKKYGSRTKSFARKMQMNSKNKQRSKASKKVVSSIQKKMTNSNLRGQSTRSVAT